MSSEKPNVYKRPLIKETWKGFFHSFWQTGMAGWKERVSTFCQYMCGVGDGGGGGFYYFPSYSTTVTALTFALTCILRIGVVSTATSDMKNHFDSQWSKRGAQQKKKERKEVGRRLYYFVKHHLAEKKSTRWIKTDLYNWQADKWNMHTYAYKRPGILILPIFYECNL